MKVDGSPFVGWGFVGRPTVRATAKRHYWYDGMMACGDGAMVFDVLEHQATAHRDCFVCSNWLERRGRSPATIDAPAYCSQ